MTPAVVPAPGATDGDDTRARRRTPVVDVFEASKDAVVNISSTQIIQVQSPVGIGSLLDELFELPNGRGGPREPLTREVRRTSVGSGFVIHSDGYVITNAHVVARTAERKVIFPDQREYDAQVVAIDMQRDLAVLKIDADAPIPALKLGRSDDLMVGETVVAIGNPLGYQHTVTSGVISALDRTIDVGRGVSFHGLIQTDASINPGNSGGPLLNVLGELIGINTAIRGDAQNIGFAISVDTLRETLPDLLAVERRYRIVTGLQISRNGPAGVVAVAPDSPAERAGIQANDVVSAINNVPVRNSIDFHIALVGKQRGDNLALTLQRDEKQIDTTLTLGGRPRPDGTLLLQQKFGLSVEPLTAQDARRIGVPDLRGLLVTGVEPASPAHAIGIRRGDILDHIAGAQSRSVDEVGEVIEAVEAGTAVPISVLRIRGNTLLRMQAAVQSR